MNRRRYASKTTANANISEEEYLSNIDKAHKIGEIYAYLEQLHELYEEALTAQGSFSPKYIKNKKRGFELGYDLGDHHLMDDHGEPNGKSSINNNNNNNNNNSNNNNNNNNNNTYMNNNTENIKRKKLKIENNNNHVNTIDNNNTQNRDTQESSKPRLRATKNNKRKTAQRTLVRDTSLLRPIANASALNFDSALKERGLHGLGYLVAMAQLLRVKNNAPPLCLNLGPALEQEQLLQSSVQSPDPNHNDGNHRPIMNHVQRRPFLNEKQISKFSLQKDIIAKKFNTQDGDIIHMPFSSEEEGVANHWRILSKSIEEWALKLAEILPGRTLADCTRYVACTNSGVGYLVSQPIIFGGQKQDVGEKAPNVSCILQKREYDYHLASHPRTVHNTIRNRQFQQYKRVSLSAVCSGATIDVKFDPTGRSDLLLVGCAKNDIATNENFSMLYNLKTGKNITLDRHKDTVVESHFSCDGERVITAGWGAGVNIWTTSGEFIIDLVEAAKLGADWYPNRANAHHSDPSIVASCSKTTKTVYAWRLGKEIVGPEDVPSENLTKYVELPGTVGDMDFSRGRYNNYLIAVTANCENAKRKCPQWAAIFDLETSAFLSNIQPHTGNIACVRTSPCGTSFITGSDDGLACISDIRTSSVVQVYNTLQPDITMVTFSRCGKFVTTAGEDNRVFVFDSRFSHKPLHVLSHAPAVRNSDHDGVAITVWSNYGEILLSGGEDNAVRIWDIKLAQPLILSLSSHNGPVSSLAISRNDQLIASGGNDWQVCLHSQVSSTDDNITPVYKLCQTLLSEMSNAPTNH